MKFLRGSSELSLANYAAGLNAAVGGAGAAGGGVSGGGVLAGAGGADEISRDFKQDFTAVTIAASKTFAIAAERDSTLFAQARYLRFSAAAHPALALDARENWRAVFGAKLRKDLSPRWQSFWRFWGEYNFGDKSSGAAVSGAGGGKFEFATNERQGMSYHAQLGFVFTQGAGGLRLGVVAGASCGRVRGYEVGGEISWAF